MTNFLISLIITAIISLFLLGTFLFTGLGILLFFAFLIIIFVILVFLNVIKKLTKIILFVILILALLFFYNNNFSDKAKVSCSSNDDCILGGTDIFTGNCYIGNKNYYKYLVSKKDNCLGYILSMPRCTNNNCTIFEAPRDYCETVDDCACDGFDTKNNACFVGNKKYYDAYVNKTQDCPDFCTGIAGNLITKCIKNKCVNVNKNTII